MSKNLKTAIIGIIVALVVGLAVNYGLISQQTADEIKAKTDEVLATEQATPPGGSSAPAQEPAPQAPSQPPAPTTSQEPAPAN